MFIPLPTTLSIVDIFLLDLEECDDNGYWNALSHGALCGRSLPSDSPMSMPCFRSGCRVRPDALAVYQLDSSYRCGQALQMFGSSRLASPASKTRTDVFGSSLRRPAKVKPVVYYRHELNRGSLRRKDLHLHLDDIKRFMISHGDTMSYKF